MIRGKMLRILLFIGFVVAGIEGYVYYPEVKQSYKFHSTPQKWYDATVTCRKENATLAMPKNEAEVSVLKKIFDGFPASNHSIFLGFHDIFREGEYITEKGESIQYYFHTWKDGQPDDYENEDCGTMLRSGLLNDLSCNNLLAFICQKNKKDDKIRDSFECLSPDPAYIYSNQTNKCYKLHLNPKTWPEARTICNAEGGILAIINSDTEKDFLVAMFTNPQNKVNHVPRKEYSLLGFHDNFVEGHYITVEGEELQSSGYTKWVSGEPNNGSGNENCGSMHISGGLNDFPCDIPAVFFCEIESNSYPSLDQRFST